MFWSRLITRWIDASIRYPHFRSLAIFAQVSRSLTINLSAKQAREALMWQKFTSIVDPYTMTILSTTTTTEQWEKLAFMLAEWIKMRDPLMSVIRPIVSKIIDTGCFNQRFDFYSSLIWKCAFRSLSTLITGFDELGSEMSESRLFLCIVLANNIHSVSSDASLHTSFV